jgi:hypothetical protein
MSEIGDRLDIRPAVRGKMEILYRGEDGVPVLTHQAKLSAIEDRKKTAKLLCARLAEKGIELVPAEVEDAIESHWARHVYEQEQRKAAEDARAAMSSAEESADVREERMLAAMPADIVDEAQRMLKSCRLREHILQDIAVLGVAGEPELCEALYLIGTSRKLPRPLAGLIKGPSASGKSYIVDRAAELMPPESVIRATQITPQALFHMKPGSLRHCYVVAGERHMKESDDTAEATRALREMIASGRLSKLMPVKIGNELESVLVQQDGPIAYVETTTRNVVFEEDENRCVSLFTDERPGQTETILNRVALDCSGEKPGRDLGRVRLRHHALQRLLARREVVVPFAPRIASLFPNGRVEARRAFPHLMSLIQTSALLHQFQRASDAAGRVVAVQADYEVARRLLADSMRRLLGKGISEPARRFYQRLRTWFGATSFTSAEARAKEETSRRAVSGWLAELHQAGVLAQLEPARGSTPARWRIEPGNFEECVNVLPDEDEVFDGE